MTCHEEECVEGEAADGETVCGLVRYYSESVDS